MSKYTTGELAKLCGITVRTVQYYDSRNILVPSEFSEGGRRLYSEDDLKRMKLICFLRNLGLSIDTIGRLLLEEHPEKVISMLLEEQEKVLTEEISERQERLLLLNDLQSELKNLNHFTVESFNDIAYIMKYKKKLRRMHMHLLMVGFLMEAIEIATLMIWILKGVWWPFIIGIMIAIVLGVLISTYYFKHTIYLCPECHTLFRPGFKEAFFARHTPKTRKLHCTQCGHHGFCIESYWEEEKNVTN